MFDPDLGPPLAREAYRPYRPLPPRNINPRTVRVCSQQVAQYAAVDLMRQLLKYMCRQFVRFGLFLFLSRSRPPQRRNSLGEIRLPSCLCQRRTVVESIISRLPLRSPFWRCCALRQSLLHNVDPLLPSRHEVVVVSDDLCKDVWFHLGYPDVVSAAANGTQRRPANRPIACCGNIHSLTCSQGLLRSTQSPKALVHAFGSSTIGAQKSPWRVVDREVVNRAVSQNQTSAYSMRGSQRLTSQYNNKKLVATSSSTVARVVVVSSNKQIDKPNKAKN